MASGFASLIQTLESADFFIGVLPFVITYAIFFLTLRNSPKFGEETPQAKRMSVLVSVAIAFFVSYFIISSAAYQQFFVTYFGTLTMGLLGILGLFAAFALTGLHNRVAGTYIWAIPVVILVGAAWTIAGGFSAFISQGALSGQYGQTMMAALDYMINSGLIWGVLILALVGWTMTEDNQGGDDDTLLEKLLRQTDKDKGLGNGSSGEG